MTTMTILRVGDEPEVVEVPLTDIPALEVLKKLIYPHLEGQDLERVAVLHNGERADMFVGERSALGGYARNEAATTIYRNNWLTQHPETDPESMPAVYGPAVLFSRRVWF